MTQQLAQTQKQVLNLLQGDLPDALQPYDDLAQQAGLSVDEFLDVARELLKSGYLRKVSALINHYRAGFKANGMCVWDIPPERVDEAGEAIARFDEVTHCYRRPVSEEWPYALFSMVHGRCREECEAIARRIADQVKPTNYHIIYSTRELKKRSMRLPLEE